MRAFRHVAFAGAFAFAAAGVSPAFQGKAGYAAGEGRRSIAETALIAEGEAIARQWCAACHAIGSSAQDTAISDAPSFHLLSEEPYLDGATLRRLRQMPHPNMPEFPLTSHAADALAAFIRSQRGAEPYDPHGTWRSTQ